MSKKNKKIENLIKDQDIKAEKELNEETEQNFEELIQENKDLKQKLEDMKQIASNSQSQYITLKYDFESYMSRVDREKSQQKINSKIDSIKNIFPFIENLRKTVENIPRDLENNDFAKWVKLIYDNMIKNLESMNVYSIDSIWKEPDIELHQPIWTEKVEDKKMKWKIVKEYEKWFYLLHDEEKNIIVSSKVIVWE